MQIDLDISTIFQALFGPTNAFDPQFSKLPARNEKFYGTDRFGQEYFLPVEFRASNETMPGKNISYAEALGLDTEDGKWQLPNPVIAARSNKTIIDTPLTERAGMVSELINIDGWRYVIKGVLIGEGNEFPEKDFNTLAKLYNLNAEIRMYNGMSDMLAEASAMINGGEVNYEVVIRSLEFLPMAGVKHVRGYLMELTSNEPFNLLQIN